MRVIAGRYELHEQIGSGGMGSVWSAFDRKSSQWVAVKVLRAGESSGLLRFVREQSLRIAHPNLLTPTGWAADDDQVALSMDLVTGGCVATLLADHCPSLMWLWDVLQQLRADDIQQRPASARLARELLAPMLPSGPVWEHDPDAPCVFDQLTPPAAAATPSTVRPLPERVPLPVASTADVARSRQTTLRVVMLPSFGLAALLAVLVLVALAK